MDKIARVRQEIKQLRREVDDHNYYLDNSEQALGYSAALNDIEKFLNTLSEEPDKSLEEEVKNYFQGYWPGTDTAEQCNTDLHFTPPAIIRLARHFAEWQKQQFEKNYKEIFNDYWTRGFEEGRADMKEQMLKDAVEGTVMDFSSYLPRPQVDIRLDPHKYHTGDKVRIVVLKEEE